MSITNGTLANKINALVQQWEDFQVEQQAWMNGVVGGGPNNDGQYPLTDYQGNIVLATCPAQLEEDVSGTVNSGAASAAAALVSENNAQSSEDDAATSETNAAVSAAAAVVSATTATTQAGIAGSHRANSLVDANAAAASAAAALISENAAAADAILTAADVVSTAADAVSTAADVVTTAAYVAGLPSTVSQVEAEAGTATTDRLWTAERVAQAIAALGGGGGGPASGTVTGAHLYWDGAAWSEDVKIKSAADGFLDILSTDTLSTTDSSLRFYTSASVIRGELGPGLQNSAFCIDSLDNSSELRLRAANSGGTLITGLDIDPDNDTKLRAADDVFFYASNSVLNGIVSSTSFQLGYAATITAQTVALADGGFEIRNDYNGDDGTRFERVLTVSHQNWAGATAHYQFSTATAGGHPPEGDFEFNSATPASVTNIYVDDLAEHGNTDMDFLWASLSDGDMIIVRQDNDTSKYWMGTVNGTPTDGTGWWTIPVTHVRSGTIFDNNSVLNISVQYLSSAGGGGLADIVDDVTPTLGGNLDAADYNISSVGDFDCTSMKVWDSLGTDSVTITHDGTDANVVLLNTIEMNFSGASQMSIKGGMDLLVDDAGILRVLDSTSTDYGQCSHDGTDFNWTFSGTTDLNFDSLTGDIRKDGYLLEPQRSEISTQNSSVTLDISHAGQTIHKATSTAAQTFTIPANASVAYPLGTLIAFKNSGSVDVSIAITTDTMTGTDGSTGTRTLGANQTAVIQKMTSTTWEYVASDL